MQNNVVQMRNKKLKLSKFNDVEDRTLRAYNRIAIFFNTLSDIGQEKATDYLRQFPDNDKKDIKAIFDHMRRVGLEDTKAAINRGDFKVA